ncbi:hypothetical protein [Paraburkholderia sp. J10-1]|uniref:hypothetical protein n=1 Tax=Paraburkholderia sp. J10-1 TaxID=2805430 RepID=UPI002AB7C468|nr:hypothetical protein [Paraburkholderia sp. J10-1]
MSAKWKQRRNSELAGAGRRKTEQRAFATANSQAIDGVVKDLGPDPGSNAGGGACVVFNMSNENITKFCAVHGGPGVKAYLNAYDLEALSIRTGATPKQVSERRRKVDHAVQKITGIPAQDIYFGAVEVNGSGMRFYGDYCLVLKVARASEWVLDRNSWDIARPPLANGNLLDGPMQWAVQSISGKWDEDLAHMLVVKVFTSVRVSSRRLTTGQISNAVLNDEDYLEVLRQGSFSADDVAEVRTSATESARDASIGDRAAHGPIPSFAELQWRQRRLQAERALNQRNLDVRVVTAPGRIR